MRYRPIEERFAEKYEIDPTTNCWIWTGSLVSGGYGMLRRYRQAAILAHRFSFQFHNGPIPDGMIVRHLCNRPSCVNPSHLDLGTHEENMRDLNRSGRARVLSNEDVIEAIDLLRSMSLNAVARRFEVDRSTLSRALNNASRGDYGPTVAVAMGDKAHVVLSQEQRDEIIRRLEAGERIMTLSKQFGVDRKTIRNIRPNNIPPPPRGRPKRKEPTK